MVRKPASMYREIKGQAYTRREYMGGVPASRVSQFEMGNTKQEFPVTMTLRVKNRVQIRHTSIEAGRIAANKVLNGNVGSANYHMTVRAFPHVVLRENKLATGAGADRVSSGMRQGFGKNVGTAARLERNQAILTVHVPVEKANFAKDALWRASMKFPSPCYIEVEKGQELIQ
ncbi:MAG: 50S ribosomal protein L16 [Candidatus Methanomethylophilaceae archaeon]|nr:50S ribosomal protein L16 [Candidatus Methanomethylophilaceae archaeon]MBQ8644581.1 50S ribosomal protein L16 [Candidatus Methanomethylophilaceae archaeon]MBR2347719.1 50S ribosomal protein L16 [Candidatus Methanomethylophilaceae archaeon]MBR2394530.1 50S ribosomal protein L16 [Candidatus Methanomethylophilaceae archaeon]